MKKGRIICGAVSKNKTQYKGLDTKKIKKAILKIKQLQIKYREADTIIVYHALDTALNQLGWDFAKLLEKD